MDIIGLIEFVQGNWVFASIIFGAGAMWYQGAMWFKKVNYKLEKVGDQHGEQNEKLDLLTAVLRPPLSTPDTFCEKDGLGSVTSVRNSYALMLCFFLND